MPTTYIKNALQMSYRHLLSDSLVLQRGKVFFIKNMNYDLGNTTVSNGFGGYLKVFIYKGFSPIKWPTVSRIKESNGFDAIDLGAFPNPILS